MGRWPYWQREYRKLILVNTAIAKALRSVKRCRCCVAGLLVLCEEFLGFLITFRMRNVERASALTWNAEAEMDKQVCHELLPTINRNVYSVLTV